MERNKMTTAGVTLAVSGRLLCAWLLFSVVFGIPACAKATSCEEMTLIESFNKISNIYNVFFTFDMEIVSDKRVCFDGKAFKTPSEAIASVLKGTSLSHKMFGGKYVIIHKNDREGLEALRKMAAYLKTFSDEALQQDVLGSVTDTARQPLSGVTVSVKGRSGQVVTDEQGLFRIEKVEIGAVLSFSYLGYRSVEVTIVDNERVSVVLEQQLHHLEDVVVVGYGSQRKVNLTGSVSSVKFEDIANRPATNTINSLQGLVPGLSIIQGGGQPGRVSSSMRIRGMGSINASANPLVIIDGIAADMAFFADLNPNDIKEVTVLKDAASAAIYGSRAANGVILVTTKEGQADRYDFSLNSYFGFQEATMFPEMMDAWDAAMLENESRRNSNLPIFFSDDQIALMKNNDPSDGFHNTDWIGEVFSVAPMQNHGIDIRGGTNRVKSFTSFNYFDQDGIVLNTSTSRLNLRNRVDYTINERFKLGLNLSLSNKKIDEPFSALGGSDASILSAVFGTPRSAPVRYNNGNYFMFFNGVPGYQGLYNPVMSAKHMGYNDLVTNSLMAGFNGEYRLGKFKYNTQVSFSKVTWDSKRWSPFFKVTNDQDVVVGESVFAQLTQTHNYTNTKQVENFLTYQDSWNKHDFSGVAGHTFLDEDYSTISGYGRDFPSNSLQTLNSSASDTQRAYGSESEYSLQSVFGRVNYGYADRYLFEGNLRYDGSSRFAKGKRYGLFPSFSVGWRLKEEPFLRSVNAVDELKVRGSWGKLGNQEIGSNYAYASTFATSTAYLVNGQLQNGIALVDLANEDLEWEVTKTLNVGLDASILKRFDITFDYFIKNTENMLIMLPIPITLGNLNPPYQNIGKVQNKGWEITGNYRGKKSKLDYAINVNLSHVKNQAVDLNGQQWFPDNQIIAEGSPLFSWYGYRMEGIFQTTEEVAGSATQTPAALPGDLRYADVSGLSGEPDGQINSLDRQKLGNSIPEFYYGFGGNLSYANFSLNVFFQGVGKVMVNTLNRTNHAAPFGGGNPQSWSVGWLDRWTPDNPSTGYPRVDYNRLINNEFSSFYLEDASYLRLKNIEIGYTIPTKYLNGLGLKKLRCYVGGQNLLTFSKVQDFDPERLYNAVRSEFYPQLKIYQAGINVTF